MALALDTQNAGNHSALASIPVSLTTTLGSGQIIVCIGTNSASVTSVTASGLTFNVRQAFAAVGTFAGIAVYSAAYITNFSGNITVALPSGTFTAIDIFAIGGADTTSGISSPPFDSHSGLPAFSGSTTVSATTSNANDFIYATCSTSATGSTQGAGWNLITGSGTQFLLTEYQIVSSTGTFTSSAATGTINGSAVDAVMQAPITGALSAQIWI